MPEPCRRIGIFLNGEWQEPLFHANSTESSSFASFCDFTKFSRIFAADGGIVHAIKFIDSDNCIFEWIGDQDSTNAQGRETAETLKKSLGQRFFERVLPVEKERSDFGSILDEVTQRTEFFQQDIVLEIFAGTGGRSDHYCANLGELIAWVSKAKTSCVAILHPNFFLFNRAIEISCTAGLALGIFGCTNRTPIEVRVEGSRYDGTHRLTRPSQGASNATTAQRLIVENLSWSTNPCCLITLSRSQ